MGKYIYSPGVGEVEEKKSRFIAHVAEATSEEEAVAFINSMKKQYFDARHNCYAFVIGENSELTRCSDDGEPSGTAGRPILEVLTGQGITNVVCVVTRYFGGTLLGTGGLVRAYQAATKEGLDNSVIIEKLSGVIIDATVSYNEVGRLQHYFASESIRIISSDYGEAVTFKIVVETAMADGIKKSLTELTSGKAVISEGGKCLFADADGRVLIYSPVTGKVM